jgi:hypothetical protein
MPPNQLSELCNLSLIQKIKFRMPQVTASNHTNVFIFKPPLSEGRVDKAWEPSQKIRFFSTPLPRDNMSHISPMTFPLTCIFIILSCLPFFFLLAMERDVKACILRLSQVECKCMLNVGRQEAGYVLRTAARLNLAECVGKVATI